MKILKAVPTRILKWMDYEIELPSKKVAFVNVSWTMDEWGGDEGMNYDITNLKELKLTDEEQDELADFIHELTGEETCEIQ